MYFNFTPSDVMRYEKDGPIVAAFLHLDRGLEQVDHRKLAILESLLLITHCACVRFYVPADKSAWLGRPLNPSLRI